MGGWAVEGQVGAGRAGDGMHTLQPQRAAGGGGGEVTEVLLARASVSDAVRTAYGSLTVHAGLSPVRRLRLYGTLLPFSGHTRTGTYPNHVPAPCTCRPAAVQCDHTMSYTVCRTCRTRRTSTSRTRRAAWWK